MDATLSATNDEIVNYFVSYSNSVTNEGMLPSTNVICGRKLHPQMTFADDVWTTFFILTHEWHSRVAKKQNPTCESHLRKYTFVFVKKMRIYPEFFLFWGIHRSKILGLRICICCHVGPATDIRKRGVETWKLEVHAGIYLGTNSKASRRAGKVKNHIHTCHSCSLVFII